MWKYHLGVVLAVNLFCYLTFNYFVVIKYKENRINHSPYISFYQLVRRTETSQVERILHSTTTTSIIFFPVEFSAYSRLTLCSCDLNEIVTIFQFAPALEIARTFCTTKLRLLIVLLLALVETYVRVCVYARCETRRLCTCGFTKRR